MTIRNRIRAGFTLIELLVVIGLIIVLASLALLISPRLADQHRIGKGADQVSGWLLIAKQRSYRDQIPRGCRLVISPNPANGQRWVKEMAYIERPVDLKGNKLQVPADQQTPNSPYNQPYYAFIPNQNWTQGDLILQGDFLQLNQYEAAPYNLHRIAAPPQLMTFPVGSPPQQMPGTLLTLAPADYLTSGKYSGIARRIDGSTSTQDLFQIVRAPRPMVGEPNLYLPRDTIIDLDPNSEGSSAWNNYFCLPGYNPGPPVPDPYYDILFSERGQLVSPKNGLTMPAGKIILRVRNGDKPANANMPTVYDWGDQFLITINTRTGLIASHPLCLDLNASGPPYLSNPYKFTRDDKSSGF